MAADEGPTLVERFTNSINPSVEYLTKVAKAAQKELRDARAKNPQDTAEVDAAKKKLDDANQALTEKGGQAVLDSDDTGMSQQLGQGRRRKRRGGRHTKRHHKKGKSKRGRTGRKSSRL
jgi:hypothetical protein